MKKILFLFALSLGLSCAASAQKTPPQVVVTTFNQKFPGAADVDWDKEKNGEWEAGFKLNGIEMSANFAAAGQWLETETEIAVSDLPQPVQAALKGKKIKEAARIQKSDGSTVYEAEVRRKDLLFDATGKTLN